MNCCHHVGDNLLEVREACNDTVSNAATTQLIGSVEPAKLVEAVPSIGKTTAAARLAANLSDDEEPTKLTYLTHRRDNREQFEEMVRDHAADESNVAVAHLPVLEEDCPTARGDHGEGRQRWLRELRDRGISPSTLHRNGALDLPCGGVDCPYMDWWLRDDQPDLIVGHPTHAYVPEIVDDRIVIVDEDPGDAFQKRFTATELHEAVDSFLDRRDDLPADTLRDVFAFQSDADALADAREQLLEAARDTDRVDLGREALDDTTADVSSADAIRALLAPEVDDPDGHDTYRLELENGVEHARLDDTTTAAYDPESGELVLRYVPEFDRAAALVALDGTPTLPVWRGRLGVDDLERVRVLCDDCRRRYLAETLGYRIVRTTEYVKPYSSGDPTRISHDKDRGLLHEVLRRAGTDVGLITTKKARSELRERDDGNDVDLADDAVAHYNDIRGSNEFAGDEIEVGVVVGSPHPGPSEMRLVAGLNADAFDTETVAEDRGGHHYSRREPRLDAEPYLRHVREHRVAQAVLRFGREDGATVFVHTAALPDWMAACTEEGSVDSRAGAERATVEAVAELGEAKTGAIADRAGYDIDTVRGHLRRLAEHGTVEQVGDAERKRWRATGAVDVSPTARVTLPDF